MVKDGLLSERTVNLPIEDTYEKIKALLIEKQCKIISEAPPQHLCFRQGSLWGISPKTAKKIVNVTFKPVEPAKTRVRFSSKIAADWKYVTLVGCVLAVVLAAICLWMATDLGTFLVTGQPSVWSWLISLQDTVEFQVGKAFVNLAYALSVFLLVVVGLEVAIYVNVHSKIERFTEHL
jgi:hypothetical protein